MAVNKLFHVDGSKTVGAENLFSALDLLLQLRNSLQYRATDDSPIPDPICRFTPAGTNWLVVAENDTQCDM